VRRRPWRCCLCGLIGYGPDVKANQASFYKHYLAMHVEKER
jgi:hypothetical protein